LLILAARVSRYQIDLRHYRPILNWSNEAEQAMLMIAACAFQFWEDRECWKNANALTCAEVTSASIKIMYALSVHIQRTTSAMATLPKIGRSKQFPQT